MNEDARKALWRVTKSLGHTIYGADELQGHLEEAMQCIDEYDAKTRRVIVDLKALIDDYRADMRVAQRVVRDKLMEGEQ